MPDPVTLPTPILEPIKVPEPPAKPVLMRRKRAKISFVPTALLVSGTAFPREAGEKMRDVFSHYCERMAARLNDKYPGLGIMVFNFYEGNQQLFEFDGGLLKKTVIKSWDKFNIKNYRYVTHTVTSSGIPNYVFHTKRPSGEWEYLYLPGISDMFGSTAIVKMDEYEKLRDMGKVTEKSLSIADVYKYINDVGMKWFYDKSDDRIVEMHIFSRAKANVGIPTLINCFYLYRDPNKTINKDPDIEDFTGNKYKYLSEAFAHPDAVLVNWGSCNAELLLPQIRFVMKSSEYKTALKDREAKILARSPGEATMSMNELRQRITKTYLSINYTAIFARRIFCTGYTAPPGVDVNLDDEKTQKKYLPLMHVFMGKEYGDPPELNYQDVLKFYNEALGFYFWDADGDYHKTYGRGYIRVYANVTPGIIRSRSKGVP